MRLLLLHKAQSGYSFSRIQHNFYNLLLIDVNMPLLDGYQLAQNLIRRDLDVRVCFMTSGEINMNAAREGHPLDSIGCFIKKPIITYAVKFIYPSWQFQIVQKIIETLEDNAYLCRGLHI